jgi:hypothetical protein
VRFLAATSFAFALTVCANGQWTVVNLHPAGAEYSYAWGVSGGKQVGWTLFDGQRRASLWTGSSSSWLDLNPPNVLGAFATDVSASSLVGYVNLGGPNHACLWSGPSSTFVDLHPSEAFDSQANGCSTSNQVGYAYISNAKHASLWSGSASSRVDLHILGAEYSEAFGTNGQQQVGDAQIAGDIRAILWNSNAISWTDLSPVGSNVSRAFGISLTNQVGFTHLGGIRRASLWSGTASSWVDLHPVTGALSEAYGVYGSFQVGTVLQNGKWRASIWNGSSSSWVDLSSFLPSNITNSYAQDIWLGEGQIVVVGYGLSNTTGLDHALMWVRPISTLVQPTSYTILQGLNFGGNLASLFDSDDNKVFVLCDEFDANGEIQFDSTLPAGTVNQLKFKFEGSASRTDLIQFVRMFNHSTNAYTNVSVQNSTILDSVVEGTITTGVASYYSGTREVRSRVLWIPQSDIDAADGWVQTCDQALWTMN